MCGGRGLERLTRTMSVSVTTTVFTHVRGNGFAPPREQLGTTNSPWVWPWDGGHLPHPKLICPSCFQHALPPVGRRKFILEARGVGQGIRTAGVYGRRRNLLSWFAKENGNAADDRWTSPGKVVASRGDSNNLRTAGGATLPRTGWTPGNARYSIRQRQA